MRIGIDLDNTIISYDALFHLVALEKRLIPGDLPAKKNAVKQCVQGRHGNATWTRLQAEVYGPRLEQAVPFDGVIEFFLHCRAAGLSTCIISHKSRFPALGEPHDLREAALGWLERKGWFDANGIGLSRSDVEFHDTRQAKVHAIGQRCCTVFVDDLPEVFSEEDFPSETSRILFDPDATHPAQPGWKTAASW